MNKMSCVSLHFQVMYSVDLLFIVAPTVCEGFVFGPSFVMQYLVSFLVFQSS